MAPESIGGLIGGVIGVIIVIIIVKAMHTDKKVKPDNDERTKAIKNQSYTYGFAATAIWFGIFTILDMFGIQFMENTCIYLYGLLVGLAVSTIFIANKGAYFASNEERRSHSWIVLLIAIGVVCLVIGSLSAVFMPLFNESGQLLLMPSLCLVVGVWELVLTAFVIANKRRQDRLDEEADAT